MLRPAAPAALAYAIPDRVPGQEMASALRPPASLSRSAEEASPATPPLPQSGPALQPDSLLRLSPQRPPEKVFVASRLTHSSPGSVRQVPVFDGRPGRPTPAVLRTFPTAARSGHVLRPPHGGSPFPLRGRPLAASPWSIGSVARRAGENPAAPSGSGLRHRTGPTSSRADLVGRPESCIPPPPRRHALQRLTRPCLSPAQEVPGRDLGPVARWTRACPGRAKSAALGERLTVEAGWGRHRPRFAWPLTARDSLGRIAGPTGPLRLAPSGTRNGTKGERATVPTSAVCWYVSRTPKGCWKHEKRPSCTGSCEKKFRHLRS